MHMGLITLDVLSGSCVGHRAGGAAVADELVLRGGVPAGLPEPEEGLTQSLLGLLRDGLVAKVQVKDGLQGSTQRSPPPKQGQACHLASVQPAFALQVHRLSAKQACSASRALGQGAAMYARAACPCMQQCSTDAQDS